jgi:hypothetical protein
LGIAVSACEKEATDLKKLLLVLAAAALLALFPAGCGRSDADRHDGADSAVTGQTDGTDKTDENDRADEAGRTEGRENPDAAGPAGGGIPTEGPAQRGSGIAARGEGSPGDVTYGQMLRGGHSCFAAADLAQRADPLRSDGSL